MKRSVTMVVTSLFVAASLTGGAFSQGKGQANKGKGQNQSQAQKQKPAQPGVCPFGGPGQGAGMGQGGWWTRVTPKTNEEKVFVAQVTEMHNQIRAAQQQLMTMRRNGAPAADIAAKEQQIATMRQQLQAYLEANKALMEKLGVPAGCGACDGSGPNGKGPGMGQGRGKGGNGQGMGQGRGRGGNGQGLRDGTGPNPNCPVKS